VARHLSAARGCKDMTRSEGLLLLQVRPNATLDELREARRRMLLRYHPDHNPGREQWAATQTRLVLEAFELLRKGAPLAPRSHGTLTRPPHPSAPRSSSLPGTPSAGDRLREAIDRRRRENAARTMSRSTVPEIAFILFSVRDLSFGLPVGYVVEVLRSLPGSLVPSGGPRRRGYLGHVAYRNTLLPVVDLAAALEIGPDRNCDTEHVVVVDSRGSRFGLAVTRVREVTAVRPSAIEPPRASVTRHRQCLRGVFARDGQEVYIPDVDAMVGLFG